MFEVQTSQRLTLGDEFAFRGDLKRPLKKGNIIWIKDRQERYGKARITDVGGKNDYKAIVVAVKL